MNPEIAEFKLFTFHSIRCRVGRTYKYSKPLAYFIEDILSHKPTSLDDLKTKLKEMLNIAPTPIEVRTSISTLRSQNRIIKRNNKYFLDTL